MSAYEISKEIRSYIENHTLFIFDDLFVSYERLVENSQIFEDFISKNIHGEIKVIFFFLSYLLDKILIRNTLMGNINKKLYERKIECKEMPGKPYLVAFHIEEKEFLDSNINKIGNYFEEFLKVIEKNKEEEENRRQTEKKERLEKIKERKEKERFILPIIKSCEFLNVTESSADISVPLFEEEEILKKNSHIYDLHEYKETKLEYVVYYYNKNIQNFESKYFSKEKENIDNKRNRFIIKLKDLLPNSIHLVLLGVKFFKNSSIPISVCFSFVTHPKKYEGRIFVYGKKEVKNNFVEDESHILLPSNKQSFSECFNNGQTVCPLLLLDNVQNVNISEGKGALIINDGFLIFAGNIFTRISFIEEVEDHYEGYISDASEQKLKIDVPKIAIISEAPYNIPFPNNIRIKKVCVGETHCMALSTEGECYSWGGNKFGQLGLCVENNEIVVNPTKIKFNVYERDGHIMATDQRPIIYDIACGDQFSLALSFFGTKQILYYWGDGAGVLDESQTVKSFYPKPLFNIDNIQKIFARCNSIMIYCYDEEKKLNVGYIHGTNKFGIDAEIGIINKPYPIIMNFFRDNYISVIKVNFSENCMSVIGKNIKNNDNIEVYLRGKLTFDLFGFKEYKNKFMKLEKDWVRNVISISPQISSVDFLLKEGIVKKLYLNKGKIEEKEIKIEGYDLNEFITDDFDYTYFQSFCGDNFVIFYLKKNQ